MADPVENFNFDSFDDTKVLADIQSETAEKGSLDLTELVNEAVGESKLLTAIEEALGESPFAFVMKQMSQEKLGLVVVKQNQDVIINLLPGEIANKLRAMATQISHDEGTGSPLFQAFKRAICSEIAAAVLVQSRGSVTLEWGAGAKSTDFRFTCAHTSDAKKARYAEQAEAKANGGVQKTQGLRDRFKRKS